MSDRTCFKTYEFGCCIVYCPFKDSPHYDKWLAVHETKNRGWWIPAGAVDYNESFQQAALRECVEEAGMKVKLRGVLRVDHSPEKDFARMRVIFYCEPTCAEEAANFKTVPDKESEEAKWVTREELLQMEKAGMLRGGELV